MIGTDVEPGDTNKATPSADSKSSVSDAGLAPSTDVCLACGKPRSGDALFCECGALFSQSSPFAAIKALGTLPAATVVGGRYQIGTLLSQRGPLFRYRGFDLGSGRSSPLPIIVLRQALPPMEGPIPAVESMEIALGDEPLDDSESFLADTKIDMAPPWPSIAWEKRLLARTPHLSMPRVLDTFGEGGFEYLIEEVPVGRVFWDAWEDLPVSWSRRCEWLIQIAEALDQIHAAGAILEGLRPEMIVVTPTSQAVLADLTDVLPLPLAANAPVRGGLYTAPEVIRHDPQSDPQSDLYSFGAMIHALLLGRELSELDFTTQGLPRPYLERNPNAHPMLGRLLARTFVHDPDVRFPSPDHFEADPTGFDELIETLKACGQTLDTIRLDVAAWTNTGVVRSANEDAVAVLHSSEARLEASDDFAVIVLADGMGGMAAGEVAAEMTIAAVRDFFLRRAPFTDLMLNKEVKAEPPVAWTALVADSLREANRVVFEESRRMESKRGMGCTAEVLLIDGRKVHIGHVGDSRTYHVRGGRIVQVTQDQTLVSQLVALGQLTEAEAERHPQRSELQQAVGGRRDVYPDQYTLTLEAGDWLLVCTDGLSNQLKKNEMASVIQSAGSAEKAARRLVNRAIVNGAADNVTVVAIRAC